MRRLLKPLLLGAFCLLAGALPAAADDFKICEQDEGDKAIAACSDAIASGRYTGHKLAELYNNRGVVWRLVHRYERALPDYDEALRISPQFELAFKNRCWARAATDTALEQGLADCNAALRLKPNDGNTLENRAFLNYRLGRLREALDDIDGTLRSNPRRAYSIYLRGLVKRKQGNSAGANADFAAAKALTPNAETELTRLNFR